jgi:Protein of unknown function (DUF2946)
LGKSLKRRRTATVQRGPANSGGWRLLVAGLALIAFAFQSYLTQTHVHLALPAISAEHSSAGSIAKASGRTLKIHQRTAPRDQGPGEDNPAKCPLCQAVGYAGQFVTPAALALVLPAHAVSTILPAALIVAGVDAPSHIWQGRAPPHS